MNSFISLSEKELITTREQTINEAHWNSDHLRIMCENLVFGLMQAEASHKTDSQLLTGIRNEVKKILTRSRWLAKKSGGEPLDYESVRAKLMKQTKTPD